MLGIDAKGQPAMQILGRRREARADARRAENSASVALGIPLG
jgi:hypothetical protein